MKRFGILMACLSVVVGLMAQPKTVDECVAMAVDHSTSLKVADQSVKVAQNARSQAISKYFPQIGVVGTYQWFQKDLELVDYGSLMYGMLLPAELRHLTRIDIENVMVADVAVVQPLFMGGKIVAANQIANLGENVAQNNVKQLRDNVSLVAQENYWLVVSLARKRTLAHSMVELMQQTQTSVDHLIREGVATESDRLNVEVRLNEALLAESKIDQNLSLAKFNLMQLCGIDLNDTIVLQDEATDTLALLPSESLVDMDTAHIYDHRTDIANLELAKKISKKEETVVLSSLLPNVVLNANYLVSNPNLYKGFDKSFGGAFNAGVSVTVPITGWISGGYGLNTAKANTHIKELEIDAAKERVQLELKQATLQYEQSQKTLETATTSQSTADVNLQAAQRRYDEGFSTILALMEAQTSWLKAKTEYIDAQIGVRLAELSLQKVCGQVK